MQNPSQEAVNRTKIVLKLLEAKRAASTPGDGSPGTGPKRSGASSKPSSATAGVGGAKARRRLASATAAAVATGGVRSTLSPQKKKVDRRKSSAGGGGDGKQERRSVKKALRASTEAYSDRVHREGGGAARKSKPWGKGGAAAGPGGIAGSVGGERGVTLAAAITVQVAFRQRMFHRFVWAQAYLRSPAHAYGVFTRCRPVSRHGSNAGFGAPSAVLPPSVAAFVDATSGNMSISPAAAAAVPQLTGGTTIEDFDAAFQGYVRWRRREGSTGSLLDAKSTDKSTEAVRPPASPLVAARGTEAPLPGSPSVHPSQAQKQQREQHQQRPEGAELFERKHVTRTAAVRSALVDLRVPFLPGALEAAVEDLERTIARENGRSAAVTASGNCDKKPLTSDGGRETAVSLSPTPTRGGAKGRGGAASSRLENPHHGGGLSFAEWYLWWTRHLPFDPASTGCLLKTVRCATALRAAEIAAAEGRS